MYNINKNGNKITILSLSWRDIRSPKAGGAEVHTHEMLKRLDKDKYEIIHLSTKSKFCNKEEIIDGVTYLRYGNVLSVIFYAMFFYFNNKDKIDFVIDQCNTHRFFTTIWVDKRKRIFYIHQLTKEIWDINAPFPISKMGKVLEEPFLKLYRNDPTITVSESTRDELISRGYDKTKIKVIHNGVSFMPWDKEKWLKKEDNPTFVYAGRYSPYKGIDVSIRAFARLKKEYPNARLWILGKRDERYIEKVLLPICNDNGIIWENFVGQEVTGDIISWGYVSEDKKLELFSKSWALLFPSIREGWGIPITEAGCVGTPTIAFNSPGIREAVDYGNAGYLCLENNELGLFDKMKEIISNKFEYEKHRENAYQFSSQFRWDVVGKELDDFLQQIVKNIV